MHTARRVAWVAWAVWTCKSVAASASPQCLVAVKKASQVLADLRGFFFMAPLLPRLNARDGLL